MTITTTTLFRVAGVAAVLDSKAAGDLVARESDCAGIPAPERLTARCRQRKAAFPEKLTRTVRRTAGIERAARVHPGPGFVRAEQILSLAIRCALRGGVNERAAQPGCSGQPLR